MLVIVFVNFFTLQVLYRIRIFPSESSFPLEYFDLVSITNFLKVYHTLYILKNHKIYLYPSNILEDDSENRMEALKNNGKFFME